MVEKKILSLSERNSLTFVETDSSIVSFSKKLIDPSLITELSMSYSFWRMCLPMKG
ncbi:hypothetical protein M1D49_07475 [Bacillus sp. PK3-056]|jgi:hypothetical protein|uniref:hypothetical protein n=1 Tax=Niallia circulans TaxID=1397 RepID=UPI00030BCD74|nr:hypothetical protein [Niallia circulans]QJX63391.1 hypothetical protein HLK66_18150 [Niallia circulans]